MLLCADKPASFQLQSNDIHLWFTKPQNIRQTDLLKRYKKLLTEDETLRQKSYIFPKKRHNELITRAFVRNLLSCYVNIHPAHWQFKTGIQGKPEIINAMLPLRFNISHSDDLIICAITLNDDIGCDVEMINRNCRFLSIAKDNFSKKEFSDLLNLPENQQCSRFFDYWTLKESYIKARGLGLSLPLKDFSFQIGSSRLRQLNENIQLGFHTKCFDNPQHWRSWLFYPNEKHRVAVSIKGKPSNQTKKYRFRYFKNIPLYKTIELKEMSFSV